MKKILVLLLCVVVSGCARKRDSSGEMMAKLDAIRAELAKPPVAPRWAVANKREIESALTQWTSAKLEEVKAQEQLAPEMQQKVAQYDSLQGELMQMQMRLMHPGGFTHGPVSYDSYRTNADYVALSRKVAEARAPIAEVLQSRERFSAKFRRQYKAEDLVAEYAKNRFDLVVDSSDASFFRSPVLYQKTGEATDITEAVLKLFKGKND